MMRRIVSGLIRYIWKIEILVADFMHFEFEKSELTVNQTKVFVGLVAKAEAANQNASILTEKTVVLVSSNC